MANNKNLKPFSELTEEQQREIRRKGGKASVEAKRRRKTMRQVLEMLLYDVELDEPTKERLRTQGVKDPKDFNHQTVINRSLIAKAEAGDVQAYNAICAMIDEKPADRMEVDGDLFNKIRVVRVHQKESGLISHSESDIQD